MVFFDDFCVFIVSCCYNVWLCGVGYKEDDEVYLIVVLVLCLFIWWNIFYDFLFVVFYFLFFGIVVIWRCLFLNEVEVFFCKFLVLCCNLLKCVFIFIFFFFNFVFGVVCNICILVW